MRCQCTQSLTEAMNIVIDVSDSVGSQEEKNETSNTLISRAFSNVARALVHMNDISLESSANIIELIKPPSVLNYVAVSWCRDVIIPVLRALNEYSSEDCESSAEELASHLIGIISEEELPIEDVAQKIYCNVCALSVFTSEETAVEILNICVEESDANIFVAAMEAISERNLQFLMIFWQRIIVRKDTRSVDAITATLYKFYEMEF